MVLNLVMLPTITLLIATRTPMSKLFGDNSCRIMAICHTCSVIKLILGGFFMAMYRIICLKRPAMKLVRQKQIVNQLLVLEFLTTAILLGFFFGASSIGDSGISVTTSICTGNSGEMDKIIQEATGKSGSLPIRLCFIFFLQSFVLAEFIIYISLFYQLYHHNEDLKKSQLLGISTKSLNQRHKNNIVSFFGQFILFVIELIITALPQLLGDDSVLIPAYFISKAIVTVAFILISPELRQYCFRNR